MGGIFHILLNIEPVIISELLMQIMKLENIHKPIDIPELLNLPMKFGIDILIRLDILRLIKR